MDGRTGARNLTEAIAVAGAVHAAPDLRLVGIAGFEGIIRGDAQMSAVDRVRLFLDFMVETARECERRGLFEAEPVILSAGGSAYYDLVAEIFGRAGLRAPSSVIQRSGCYLTHDHQMYQKFVDDLISRSPASAKFPIRPRPALEVWTMVQSRPQPALMICAGKRDVGPVDLQSSITIRRATSAAAALSGVPRCSQRPALMYSKPKLSARGRRLDPVSVSHPLYDVRSLAPAYVIGKDGSVLGGYPPLFFFLKNARGHRATPSRQTNGWFASPDDELSLRGAEGD